MNVGTPELLDCNSMRQFWIEWAGNEIVLGSGSLGSHRIFSYTEQSGTVSVGAVSLSTYLASTGEWEVLTKDGQYCVILYFYLSQRVI